MEALKNHIYIAGQVTGLPYPTVQASFMAAKNNLIAQGYTVINPVEITASNTPWPKAMRGCISVLMDCSHIYMLANWQASKGATLERMLAQKTGIIIIYQNA